jgi:indole-3-glycerol phosphate synthase
VIETRPADVLETIVAATRRIVADRRDRIPLEALSKQAVDRLPDGAGFQAALARIDRINVIAECKRRSPSRGVLRAAYDPVAIATGYASAGAAALSILTEPTFFDGDLSHLESVRRAVRLPLLRKDFVVDEYQLVEARAFGADAVLLIVAALSPHELRRLRERAADLQLAALVEVHSVDELHVALDAGADLVGVNNRNLRTLTVDTAASETIAGAIPPGVVAVSESGLGTPAGIARMRALGYHAFLIGERFMTSEDPGLALASLLAGAETPGASGTRSGVDRR